jgi:hypothetical protein
MVLRERVFFLFGKRGWMTEVESWQVNMRLKRRSVLEEGRKSLAGG